MHKIGSAVMLAVVLVMVLAVVVLASDGVPDGLLDDVAVTFGAVTLAWLSVQRGAIHVLKGISIGGRPLLGTPQMVWLANAVLAVVGLSLAATQSGQPLAASLIQAVLAFLAASGLHEFNTTVGKSSDPGGSVPTGTVSTENGGTQRAPT